MSPRGPSGPCPVPTGTPTCTSFLGKGPRSFSGQLMGGMTQSLFCRRRPCPCSGNISTSGTVPCWDRGSAQCQPLAEPSAPGTGAAVTPGSGSELHLLHPLVVSVLVPPPVQRHLG